jgi:CSLREA domain-containing protein
MTSRPRVALTLLAALFLLAFPAAASAAVYEVNTALDEPDKTPGAPCETSAAGICSLRAAIEVANSTVGVPDEIKFSAIFNGEDTDGIGLLSPLPTIVDELKIHGGECDTDAGVKGPCVSAIRAGGALFVVEHDDVEIQGMGLMGAGTAINVTNASERFVAKGDWIGFNLAGIPGLGAVNGIGIFLDPGSDGATIGGLTAADRNVIGGNSVIGLELEGASGATIQGNYFGITPQGDEAASNPTDIRIADSTAGSGFPAENNEIGETIEGAALTSDACDGGCNVISGAPGTGVDLSGPLVEEEPATGPTIVHGNFVGLEASGTEVAPNGSAGIQAGAANNVTVGGPVAGDANYIAGEGEGITSENGESFKALHNRIGFGSDGSAVTPPNLHGIFVLGQAVSEESNVEFNAVRSSGIGIDIVGLAGRIIGNELEGGSTGILAGFGEGEGLIAGNEIDAPGEFGILIQSAENDVRGNTVTNSSETGIAVKPPPGVTATIGNVIGGSTTDTENVIDGSAGPAIEIVEEAGEPGSWTEITRNHGSGNVGRFIDLSAGANEGIVPPVFTSADKASSEGTGAEPNATIRVFRKAVSAVGELQSFLGETEADGSGNWKVTYPSIPGGTIVAATQTKESGATSELSTATVPADPSGGGGGEGGSGGGNNGGGASSGGNNGGGNNGGGNVTDKTPPDTRITKAPPKKTRKTTVKFKFSATEAGSSFQCKMDSKPFKPCRSPKTYKKLKPGKHVFKVRATDQAGNVDPTPAKRKFTVLS